MSRKPSRKRVYAADRMADYGETTDVVSALFGNLGTGIRRGSAALTASNERQLAAIAGLRARQGAGTDMKQARGSISRLYGSSIAGATAPLLRLGDTKQKAGETAMKGATRAGAVTAASGKAVMSIFKSGAQEAGSAAEYATAQALRYRAKSDAKLLADEAAAQDQAAATAALEFKYWKKQQQYLQNHPEGGPGGAMEGIGIVTDRSVEATAWMRNYLAEAGAKGTVPDLVTAATAQFGDVIPATVLSQLAAQVNASVGDDGQTADSYEREDEAQDLLDSILLLYPNYKKEGKLQKIILSGLQAQYSSYDAPKDPPSAGGETFGTGSVDVQNKTVALQSVALRAQDMGVSVEELVRELESKGWTVV